MMHEDHDFMYTLRSLFSSLAHRPSLSYVRWLREGIYDICGTEAEILF